MKTATETTWPVIMTVLGFDEDADLMAMHVGEFEEEAENVLELLTVLRADARERDTTHAQDTTTELVIALEHLAHHLGELLPRLQKQLDIEP